MKKPVMSKRPLAVIAVKAKNQQEAARALKASAKAVGKMTKGRSPKGY